MEHFINVKTNNVDRIIKDFIFKKNVSINKNFEYINRLKLEYFEDTYITKFEYKYKLNNVIKNLIPNNMINNLMTFINEANINIKTQIIKFVIRPKNNDHFTINGNVEFCKFSEDDSICKVSFKIDFKNSFVLDNKIKEFMYSLIKKEIESAIEILNGDG